MELEDIYIQSTLQFKGVFLTVIIHGYFQWILIQTKPKIFYAAVEEFNKKIRISQLSLKD